MRSTKAAKPQTTRRVPAAEAKPTGLVWGVGDAVLVKQSGSASSRRGKVKRLRSIGTIDVLYDNGSVEERVNHERLVRPDAKRSAKRVVLDAPPPVKAASKKSSSLPPQLAAPGPVSSRSNELFVAPESDLPRRAKTADASYQNAQNPAISTAVKTTSRRSSPMTGRSIATATAAKPSRPNATTTYGDMSDALSENQKQVTDVLDRVSANGTDETIVVRCQFSVLS